MKARTLLWSSCFHEKILIQNLWKYFFLQKEILYYNKFLFFVFSHIVHFLKFKMFFFSRSEKKCFAKKRFEEKRRTPIYLVFEKHNKEKLSLFLFLLQSKLFFVRAESKKKKKKRKKFNLHVLQKDLLIFLKEVRN